MKKQIMIAGFALMTAISFGQKKEIRKAEKAVKAGEIGEAMDQLAEAEPMLASADNELKAYYYAIKGDVYLANSGKKDFEGLKTAAASFSKSLEIEPDGDYAEFAKTGMQNLRVQLVNGAIDDQNSENYKQAAEKLYVSYTVSPADTSDLYYAAGNLLNAKDYEGALSYYERLIDLGFTNIKSQFAATNKETGDVKKFANKTERDLLVVSGEYIKPEMVKSESVRPEILRTATLIYSNTGQLEKAKAMIKEARIANPEDASLIRAEADIAYQEKDMDRYNELMKEIIATDPNNPEIYYNLGVGSAQNGDTEGAMKYYKKALELKPDYSSANINMAAILLANESKIVEEMNNLGTSAADNKRYDELKQERTQLYTDVVPYLENALKSKPNNVEATRTLMNIYSTLGMDDKFKATKARLAELEAKN
ncbi:MAG: tetratricopeptide repeat protein [Flavobacteriaceae bacterium]|nr:tetratricopeptide repeat protein [Flavobacteriaceae bacterium]